MIPKQIPEGFLIQGGDAHAVRIRLGMFGGNVHGKFGKVKVRADAGRGGDAGGVQYLPDHGFCQVVGVHLVVGKISSSINKYLINGVNHNIFRRNVF